MLNKTPEPQGHAMPAMPAHAPKDGDGKEPAARRACVTRLSDVKMGTDNSMPQQPADPEVYAFVEPSEQLPPRLCRGAG